ncbi:2-amino-3-carboxymuconate-6-semialdehyde decarboxylase [Penicillium alfredii]|uniref:2-amino-3-carboxymuconate-6-semialdehyde decarboxylase n=1 Tax=Penicillium alfredii TaxID=1506179 RepID=A0A9W9FKD6_9EURO|nr:2-amino-3-carboxymuconate-6-semialdehyde decarboxylase [Penicillium alfredii]KAJ5101826.1 2-amino-3-carboxymuconate-6-semialdehyde decarboxylase [Penicillium alfredii]
MPLVVDIHTHVYPPSYLAMLRTRKTVPYIHDPSTQASPRLIILSSDDDPAIPLDQRGRPIDASYSDISTKLSFMKQHGINSSVISLANPWLDFLVPKEAQEWAQRINDDLEFTCAQANHTADPTGTRPLSEKQTLFAFGALPLSAPDPATIVTEIQRLSTLPHMRGVIMGTSGLGTGLDDPRLDPIWAGLQDSPLLLFLHPHYGLPDDAFGADTTNRYGHVLPLALGFPLETTIAVTRMLLAGVFDRFPRLRVLLAHSGGALPFLAGRIESCIRHERKFVANGGQLPGPRRSVWDVLSSNVYLDAVVYGSAGLKAAVAAGGGSDRLLFGRFWEMILLGVEIYILMLIVQFCTGTDHPFFPPLGEEEQEWPSVTTNYKAIHESFDDDRDAMDAVLGGNAVRILDLK